MTSLSPRFTSGSEYVNLQFIPVMRRLADRGRMVFNFDAIGFILGLGYVMGLRSAIVFCAGGVLANFVLVPLIWFLGSHINTPVYPGTMPVCADDGRRKSTAIMCASSASAPSPRRASWA